MIPVQLSLKNKKVLIVGGGKVALRKAKLFLKETDQVSILAPEIQDELIEIGCQGIHKEYESFDIIDYFLVYACTDNKELNHRIVTDAHQHNILCGSATYDEDASFYSMGSISHDIGTLALSMNQCLPYHKPLLNKMKNVLDENQIRIEKLFELRPFVLGHAKDKKKYFDLLFESSLELLDFLLKVYNGEEGNIFVYHDHEYNETLNISKGNSIVLSINELNQYAYLFNSLTTIKIIPLVLTKGYIYNKIQSILPSHPISLPLLTTKNNIRHVIELYEDKDKTMVYIIHPSRDDYLKRTLKECIRESDVVIDFDENITLDINKQYKCIVFLMSHGRHFKEYNDLFDFHIKQGYNIEYIGCLSDDIRFINYIIKKVE